MNPILPTPPVADPQTGWLALSALLAARSPLAALAAMHTQLGAAFQITLPGFQPIVLVGPEANRFVLVSERDALNWRSDSDPVTDLLRHGVLVVDGEMHATLRGHMNPALHKQAVAGYATGMLSAADEILDRWPTNGTIHALDEMRALALHVLLRTLFDTNILPELERLWPTILKLLSYISPGVWLVWPGVPRIGYGHARRTMDAYLGELIRQRAARAGGPDLIGLLLDAYPNDPGLIRDQLLTMLIAGHDTSTALLTWALHLLTRHPAALARARAEVDLVLGSNPPALECLAQLEYLDRVIKETLRLYPPIHLGSRLARRDLVFGGYRIPAGTRVIYSIYLTHRLLDIWPEPERFDPDRFLPDVARTRPTYSYLPFGGGARNCIGFAFTQIEAKILLARILQRFDISADTQPVRARMGATLEPLPGLLLTVRART